MLFNLSHFCLVYYKKDSLREDHIGIYQFTVEPPEKSREGGMMSHIMMSYYHWRS